METSKKGRNDRYAFTGWALVGIAVIVLIFVLILAVLVFNDVLNAKLIQQNEYNQCTQSFWYQIGLKSCTSAAVASTTTAVSTSSTPFVTTTPSTTTAQLSTTTIIYASCTAQPGYICNNVTLSNGRLSFTVGQNTGTTIWNVQAACVAVGQNTYFKFYATEAPEYIENGHTINVYNLLCGGNVNSISSIDILLNYTTSPFNYSGPWNTREVATAVT